MLTMALVLSCSERQDNADPVVARAFQEQLRWSDLRQVIPLDAEPEDSAVLATSFINNWLREQVVLEHADRNLSEEQKDFSARMRSYHNSLIIYAYEQALVDQKLDTIVGRDEILRHLEANPEDHRLRGDIIRARWFKVREDDRRTLKRLQDHFLSGDPGRMGEVEVWLAQRGITISETGKAWMELDVFLAEVPLPKPGNTTLSGRSVLRTDDGMWFVDILEHLSRGSISPVELVERDIRSVIINQRKVKLLERMREDLYSEALERRDIEIP